jgi:restriction system protein
VAWAKTYLKQAGILTPVRRGIFRITDRGREILLNPPDKIDISFLEKYPEFIEFKQRRTSGEDTTTDQRKELVSSDTPEETLEAAYQNIREELANELLEAVKANSYQFFERLVIELLVKMGYGGSRKEAGNALGKSGDEGIDGIINEDRLGLDTIYLQAKKWEGTVGRPEIQKFVGALHGKRAKKGVFITTGSFSSEAKEYVSHIDPKVVLIDGNQLSEYMMDFGLGVSTTAVYETKNIDTDYFTED